MRTVATITVATRVFFGVACAFDIPGGWWTHLLISGCGLHIVCAKEIRV